VGSVKLGRQRQENIKPYLLRFLTWLYLSNSEIVCSIVNVDRTFLYSGATPRKQKHITYSSLFVFAAELTAGNCFFHRYPGWLVSILVSKNRTKRLRKERKKYWTEVNRVCWQAPQTTITFKIDIYALLSRVAYGHKCSAGPVLVPSAVMS